MNETNIYREIAERTSGAFMLGIVGPVRTGKSTFIKHFMEKMVIPNIENDYIRERTIDELPQSGSGKTIMTVEPKFIPEDAITINISENSEVTVRLVDCVGYMVDGATGQYEDGSERMVTTPWFDHEVSITDAAEKGTHKVITEHSTVGIVITTDGSICDIPREKYVQPEDRVINELLSIGKPFVVLLNTADPLSDRAIRLTDEISAKHGVKCIAVNCKSMDENDYIAVLRSVLEEFPIKAAKIYLPEWLEALPTESYLRKELYSKIYNICSEMKNLRDGNMALEKISTLDGVESAEIIKEELGCGQLSIEVCLPRDLYYRTISEETGLQVNNDADLISTLAEMGSVMSEYTKLKSALDNVRRCGYGVVLPDSQEMTLEEPQIVRQGGKYSVKLKASAPAIHMIMTDIETEVTPALGGETASEDIINFLLQGFDGDVNRIWQSNIFGKSLYDIAEEGLNSKIESLPENAKQKIKETLQRVINEGCGGIICILL